MVFRVLVYRLLLKSPLADPPQVYRYALLVCKFGTEIVALTLHFCFDCATIVADSAIERYEICLPHSYILCSFALDMLMAEDLPQMELYCEIGRLVCNRPEKGAAVAAAEYLQSPYPDVSGFSPRNLRRMREFWRTYGETPIITEAMKIGWSQNVVVLEAELTLQEKAWYIRAVQQLGWSKMELQRQISVGAHLIVVLDGMAEVCYREFVHSSFTCVVDMDSLREWRMKLGHQGMGVYCFLMLEEYLYVSVRIL